MKLGKHFWLGGVALISIAPAGAQTNPPLTTDATAQPAAPAVQGTGTTAQEPDSGGLADIVVTARKRIESIQSVPVAISVVSGDQLQRQQVVELRDLSRSTASLQFGTPAGASPGGGAVIRGIGTVGFSKGAEASVGVVVDGVVQGNTNINNLFDIARVEVLRGPQGTLFGQSTSAGVINVSTVAPSFDRVSGRVSTELSGDGFAGSQFGRQVVRAAINLPLADNQAIRVSAFGNRTTGVNDNVTRATEDNQREGGIRARYLLEAGPLTVNLIGDYSKSKTKEGDFNVYYYAKPGTRLAQFLAQCGVTPGPKNFTSCGGDQNNLGNTQTYGGSAQFDLDLGGHTLTSITAYRGQDVKYQIDVDGFPDGVSSLNLLSQLDTTYRQFTQEVRLASADNQPLTYVIGGFYQKAHADNLQPTRVQIDLGKVFPGGPLLPATLNYNGQFNRTSNIAAFGEARYSLNDALTIFAGARVNRNKVSENALEQVRTTTPFGPVRTSGARFRDTNFSWRVGAQYKVTPTAMIYGSVSTGYKGAQISDIDVDIPAQVVQPEKPLDFELGLKTNLLNDNLGANINLFYTRVKNYQAQLCTVDALAGTNNCTPLNVSKVITKGVEADVFGRPFRGLTVNANFLFNPAKYPRDFGGLAGQQVAFAPKYKATISGEYSRPVGGGGAEAFVSADGTYRSRTRLDIARGTSDLIYKSSFVFGGRFGVRMPDNWTFAIFAKNLGALAVPSSLNGNPALPVGDPNDAGIWAFMGQQAKRLVGIQAELNF